VTQHETAVAGLWLSCYRDSEDGWTGPFFDSREEAVAHGRIEHRNDLFYVGMVGAVCDEEMAAGYLLRDEGEGEEDMCESEGFGPDDPLIDIPPDRRLALVRHVAEWLRAEKCVRGWFSVVSVERVLGENEEGGAS
jgi:hypothetical protein